MGAGECGGVNLSASGKGGEVTYRGRGRRKKRNKREKNGSMVGASRWVQVEPGVAVGWWLSSYSSVVRANRKECK